MSGPQKVSLSLLISILVFSAVAVLAAVDRFQILETRFYIPRVEESVRLRTEEVGELFERFHRANIERFREFTLEPAVRSAFRINASAAEIRERQNRLDTIEQERASLDLVRVIDVAAEQLHYSSSREDFIASETQRTYERPDTASAGEPRSLSSLAYYEDLPTSEALPSGDALPEPEVFLEPASNQFVYRLPAVDATGVLQGAALFYVNTSDLRTSMIRAGLMGSGDVVRVVNSGGVVANVPAQFASGVVAAVDATWADIADLDGRETVQTAAPGEGELQVDASLPSVTYEAFSTEIRIGGIVVYLEPAAALSMPEALQYTLLVAVFLTTFLIVFLVLNVRQDAIVIISNRVKRFQIGLLREYMDNGRDLDFQRWKAELEDRRDEVQREIRRGIGRVKPSDREEVDRLINESWDEIISVLSSRAEEPPSARLDVDRIEEIVEQLSRRLEQSGFGRPSGGSGSPVPAVPAPVVRTPEPAGDVTPPSLPGTPVDVEELSEDDEELEELDDAAEPEEVDEPSEAVEVDTRPADQHAVGPPRLPDEVSLDSLDELAELEWLAETEAAELPGPKYEFETSQRPGPALEDESISEDDEIAEPEELSYWEETDEDQKLTQTEAPEELEELEESDEAEERDEFEEIDEVEELEEIDETEEPGALEEVEERLEEQLEELEPDEPGGEPATPEELPADSGASTTFGSGIFSFGRGVEVRSAEPGSGLEDADGSVWDDEDVLEAEPVDASAEAETGGGRQPDGLIRFDQRRDGAADEYEVASVSEILDRLHVDKQIIVESDGVVEIDRGVYTGGQTRKDEEIRGLVDSVIGEPESSEGAGIESLFGDGADDLLSAFRPEVERERIGRRIAGTSVFRFLEHGFDYDAFLRGYQVDEGGILKSLVRFTRFWNARVGIVLSESDVGFEPSYQLGLNARCAESLGITKSSGLYRNVLARRNVLFIRQPIVNVEYFHGLCDSEHLALFERTLLLPAVFRGESAYMLLGMSRSVESMEAAFRNVVPYLARPQGVPS